jgi:hypothetical protein
LFQETTGDRYLAGLWKSHVIENLGWYVDQDKADCCTRPLHYRAPSWSWASVDGPVHIPYCRYPDQEVAKLVDAYLDTSLNEPTGQVFGGWILLEGVLLQATYHSGTAGRSLNTSWSLEPARKGEQTQDWYPSLGASIPGLSGDLQVCRLPLMKSDVGQCLAGLLLILEPGSSDVYTRIGSFRDYSEFAKTFDTTNAPKSKIKII